MGGRSATFCRPCFSGGFTSDTVVDGASPSFVGVHPTFALLDAALLAFGVPDFAVGMLVTASGHVGLWQLDNGKVYLCGMMDLRHADAATFRAGTDYILHGAIGATWATPGVSTGGLILDTNGLVTWPAAGIMKGLPGVAIDGEFVWDIGTPTTAMRCGAGTATPNGDAHSTGGIVYSTAADWYKTVLWGALSTPSQAHVNNTAPNYLVGTPDTGWGEFQNGGIEAGNTFGSYNANWVHGDERAVTADRTVQGAISAVAEPNENDHRLCMAFNDAGDATTTVRATRARMQGLRT